MTEPSLLTSFDSENDGVFSGLDSRNTLFIMDLANYELYNMWEENRKLIRKNRNVNHKDHVEVRGIAGIGVNHHAFKEIDEIYATRVHRILYSTIKPVSNEIMALIKSEDKVAKRMGILLVLNNYVEKEDLSI